MADTVNTQSGNTFAISTTAENDDLTDHAGSGFPSLVYVAVSKVGSIPNYGQDTNILSYDTLDRDTVLKQKGMTDAGEGDLEVARDDTDAGQLALRAAALTTDNYAFRVTRQDGSVDYLRGLITGPVQTNGRNEDFDLHTFKLALNQIPVHVDAP
jgi:hypothetical protein